MNKVEKLFKDKTDEISFIELRENTQVKINNSTLKSKLPLPVITDNLIKDIQESKNKEEINLDKVIEGIIYLMGIDSDFPYIEQYKEILENYNPNINDYIFYKGMKALESRDLINSGICFRALLTLDNNNLNARFNYALVLEELGKEYIYQERLDEGAEFLEYSAKELETILEIDKGYSLAYYKLGFHYKYNEEYLKASLIWNKFLILDKDENRLQEIREEINIIDDEVKLETGITYLSYNDYSRALDAFLKLLPKYNNDWNVNFLISKCYRGLGNNELAIEYLEYAIELENAEPDLYNELGIIHFTTGDINKAISIFEKGIHNTEDEYKLYFNRGLAYLQIGQYNLALKDINTAYNLNPYDDGVAMQKEELENFLKNL